MDNQAHAPEVFRRERPSNPRACLVGLPTELIFRIVDLALAVGQERDVSALARTNKTMHFIVNTELYRLVVKHKTFHIVNWAARHNRVDTLKIALAHGANPNQMRISAKPPRFNNGTLGSFRPVGWSLLNGSDLKLDLAVWRHNWVVRRPGVVPALHLRWSDVWFSSASLSITNPLQLNLLSERYLWVLNSHNPNEVEQFREKDDARPVRLSKPLDENFTFPKDMSPADMDRREVKMGFVRLFRYWDSPLHLAARHDRSSATEALLANGADVDCTSVGVCNCGRHEMPTSMQTPFTGDHVAAYTPLHVAICMGSYRAAKVLVASGAKRMAMMFTGKNNRQWLSENTLHRALSAHPTHGLNYDFIKFLLDHGYAARIEERNHESLTPLLIALNRIGDPVQSDVLNLLLRYGADPNNPGPCSPSSEFHRRPLQTGGGGGEWATPAVWATREGNFWIAKFLLNHGADAMARSSILEETLLFAACTATDRLALAHNPPVGWSRMELLDAVLESGVKQDLNRFHTADDRTPLMDLIRFKLFREPRGHTGGWETKVFRAGADILAGVETGKQTPFETMIMEVLDIGAYQTGAVDVGDRLLAILEASRINRHRHRPRAFLNQLWGYVDRSYESGPTNSHGPAKEIVPYMLLAFIKAGFSPAEVDRHGDTAMTSFLQQLLKNPKWARRDCETLCAEGWVLPMLMAIMQEHGAALDKRNDKGYTAFDYLRQIVKYDGQDSDLFKLRRAMRRSVQPDLGHRCLKFHRMRLFGGLSGDTTIERIYKTPIWMPCVHFCRCYCSRNRGSVTSRLCGHGRHPSETFAECDGGCCNQDDLWD